MTLDSDTKYLTTVRMDTSLGERLGLISQVRSQSKNSLIVAAIKQLVTDIEGDSEFQRERKQMLDRWSSKEELDASQGKGAV